MANLFDGVGLKKNAVRRLNMWGFVSCDNYIHPDDCDCGACFILGRRQVRKTTALDGGIVFYSTERKKGNTVVRLVRSGEDEYEAIAQEWGDNGV